MKKYTFLRVEKDAAENLKVFKEYLQKTKGGKWTDTKVIEYLLSKNEETLADKLIAKFDEFKMNVEFILKLNNISSDYVDGILEQISIFEAFILQQLNGHIDISAAIETMNKLPSLTRMEIETRKKKALSEVNEILNNMGVEIHV